MVAGEGVGVTGGLARYACYLGFTQGAARQDAQRVLAHFSEIEQHLWYDIKSAVLGTREQLCARIIKVPRCTQSKSVTKLIAPFRGLALPRGKRTKHVRGVCVFEFWKSCR